MKSIIKVLLLGGVLVVSSLAIGPTAARGQSTLTPAEYAAAVRALEATTPLPASAAPKFGNFYTIQHGEAWPPLPGNTMALPFWSLGCGVYLLDDENVNYTAIQSASASRFRMDDDFEPDFQTQVYTSNELYLTNMAVTSGVASMVIHQPSGVTNGAYILLYSTNLASPISWQQLLHTAPGQTNLVVTNATDAQGFYALGPPDSPGTDFWVAYLGMTDDYQNDLLLCISSPFEATGTVTIPGQFGGPGSVVPFSVAPGAATLLQMPIYVMQSTNDTVETNNAINISASAPVSVYVLDDESAGSGTSAAYTAFPTTLLGTNYLLLARPSYTGYSGLGSDFAIIATANHTMVHINPSATADLAGHYPTNLDAGETYQIYSSSTTGDVTGTVITSDKPIAVLAGANAAYVPDANTQAWNPLVQEQIPVEDWGTNALALSFAGRMNGDTYRILAASNNTLITITGTVVTVTNESAEFGPWLVAASYETNVVTITNAGQFYDIGVDGPVQFQANKPIQVAQFANGAYFDAPAHGYGDPCEILLPPTDHYLETNIVYSIPSYTGQAFFAENYLNVIVLESAITNTFVGTNLITDLVPATNFVEIGNSGYYGVQIPAVPGYINKVTSSQPIGVELYGWGNFDSYGYFGGMVK